MMRLERRSTTMVLLLVAWPMLFAPSHAAEPKGPAQKTAVRESFKFDPNDDQILIPVHVGGKDYQFVLDTGATVSVFDISLRSHLGPRVDSAYVEGAHDNVRLELCSPLNARVGSLLLTKDPVVCFDFTPARKYTGCDVHGIIGMDFLKDWIITIDFDEGRLDILPSETERSPKWGECILFVYGAGGLMSILAMVDNNVQMPFMVDTGTANTGSIEETLLTRLVNAREARCTGDGKTCDISGMYASRVARLSHFSFHSFQHENLQFTSDKKNILGLKYLSRYLVTIDFPNQRMYLAKGKHFADHDYGRTHGLCFSFKADGLAVEAVDEQSPAYAAGVRAKDVIVKLCDKPVSAWKPSEINRLLRTEGKPVQMTVERGGKRLEMNFTPKEYD
jgi:hypothetical protein